MYEIWCRKYRAERINSKGDIMKRYDKDLQKILKMLDALSGYYADNQYALSHILSLRREVKEAQEKRITDKINKEIEALGKKYNVILNDAEDYGPGIITAHLPEEEEEE